MKDFSDYEFKPSDVIEGLNDFYRRVGERRRFEAKYGLLSGAAGPFLVIKRRCGDLKTSFYDSRAVEEAIAWLREECDIFYTPGLKWEDLKYKLTSKACEKEYGTTDIREMYPRCLVSPRGCGKSRAQFEAWRRELPWTAEEREKIMNYCMNDVICTKELAREKERIDGKEALEALRTLYYGVATRHERALKRLNDYDVNWPETSYMVEYIRKRVETADENIEYLCKENDNLRNQVQNLKDLINKIHEDSDI
ncbi:MAG: hypothetical protein J6U28_08575 [Bacteroidales bacterium]|nr:hypothetical protein [Bacteroidales bacterium]MBP5774258.1 hypothetical protein [Clostridiales bacterium]